MGPKKGKKGKKEKAPEILTTKHIVDERLKMNCPRMGDIYTLRMQAEEICEDICRKKLEKIIAKQEEIACLSGLRLEHPPDLSTPTLIMRLTEVNLSKNNLFNSNDLFTALSQLLNVKKINVNENCLNGVLPNCLGDIETLEVLHMDCNQITGLPLLSRGWKNLKVITAAHNHITEIPSQASEWSNILYINLKDNKLSDLPAQVLPSWDLLERLTVSMNKIKVIPDEIGSCVRLMEFDISSNIVEAVPERLSNCVLLQLLQLGDNKIQAVPVEIFAFCVQLRDLQLYKNKLTYLPAELGSLTNLKRLSLSSNNFRTLPEEIGACAQLRELYINNNAKFAMLPGSAGHLRQLRELALRKCPALKSLPNTTQDMVSLRELDVRAPKKQVCKIPQEMADQLKEQNCTLRGGVVKKGKGKKGK